MTTDPTAAHDPRSDPGHDPGHDPGQAPLTTRVTGGTAGLRWTLTEAADRSDVSRSTLRRRVREGAFPHAVRHPERGWLIGPDDLVAAGIVLTDPPEGVSGPPVTTPVPDPGQARVTTPAHDPGQAPVTDARLDEVAALREAKGRAEATAEAAERAVERERSERERERAEAAQEVERLREEAATAARDLKESRDRAARAEATAETLRATNDNLLRMLTNRAVEAGPREDVEDAVVDEDDPVEGPGEEVAQESAPVADEVVEAPEERPKRGTGGLLGWLRRL